MAGFDPNSKLKGHLAQGTQDLRAHLGTNVIKNNNRELDRLEQYYLHWKFYEGKHYREFNHTLIKLNYCRAFVDKQILFLLGDEGFALEAKSLYNDHITDEEKQPIEELLMYQWKRNNKELLIHEFVQMGSICGDAWCMATWEPNKKYVKLHILDSRQCFPVFLNGDMNTIESFQVRQELVDHPKYKIFVTNYRVDKVETWYQEQATLHNPKATLLSNKFANDIHEYTQQENPLNFIPIVHVKNNPNSQSYFGRSDLQDIVPLNKVYNELHQELKGIIDYHSTPTTVVTGAVLKNMERGLGKIWSGLPPESNVFTLGLDADLSSMQQFLDRLKTAMHEISDVPENVLGKIQAITGTSAAALQLTYQPLVHRANIKALQYGEGIAELNEMMLQMIAIYDPKNKRLKGIDWASGDYRVEPVFKYGFPTDRMNMLQEMTIEQNLNMLGRQEGMIRLGKNNVPDLIEKIDQERINEAMLQAEIQEIEFGSGEEETPPLANDKNKNIVPVPAKKQI